MSFEPVELLDTKRIVGRKAHQCDECLGVIPTGEAHERNKYLFEGKWYVVRTCDSCVALIGDYCKREHCGDGYAFTYFHDEAQEESRFSGSLSERCREFLDKRESNRKRGKA